MCHGATRQQAFDDQRIYHRAAFRDGYNRIKELVNVANVTGSSATAEVEIVFEVGFELSEECGSSAW
jgi:hypothetical protein